VADLQLQGQSGIELVARLRQELGHDVPAIIITGHNDLVALSAASRLRPVEVINKPVDIARLRQTVQNELARVSRQRQVNRRTSRLRSLTKHLTRQRRRTVTVEGVLADDMVSACKQMQARLDRQETVIRYQGELLTCKDEDDIFRRLFRLFAERTGALYGAALLCDSDAELQMIGRFGVPQPDGINFCQNLAMGILPSILQRPAVTMLDAMDHVAMFPEAIHRRLVGLTVLTIPLMANEGELIGMVVLYRKGEQPFVEDDLAMAEAIAAPTAAAAQRV
jgi:FixJ family two-component response regulator